MADNDLNASFVRHSLWNREIWKFHVKDQYDLFIDWSIDWLIYSTGVWTQGLQPHEHALSQSYNPISLASQVLT
jgi:hypothetical protein